MCRFNKKNLIQAGVVTLFLIAMLVFANKQTSESIIVMPYDVRTVVKTDLPANPCTTEIINRFTSVRGLTR